MASWRAPGSILEGPGLDFGGSGAHFLRFWASEMEPRTPRIAENLPNKNSITNGRIAKGRWAAVIPPGGFQLNLKAHLLVQSATPRRGAWRARLVIGLLE